MAIISCPECGGSISDTVKACIHCGCKINYCKECGSISVGDQSACETCGFVFGGDTAATESASEQKSEIKNTKELYQKWGFENSFIGMINKSYLVFAMLGVSILMAAIAVVKIIKFFKGTNSLDALFAFPDNFSSIKTFVILAFGFYILFSAYDDIRGHIVCSNMEKWIAFNKVDTASIIRNSLSVDFAGMSVDEVGGYAGSIEAFVAADIYSKDILAKLKERRMLIGKIVLSSLSAVLLCIFIINNLEIYMLNDIVNGSKSFETSMIEKWWMLIGSALGFVVGKILGSNADKLSKGAADNWIKENAPEYAEVYEKYVKNYIEYVVDKSDTTNRKV